MKIITLLAIIPLLCTSCRFVMDKDGDVDIEVEPKSECPFGHK